MSKKRFNSEEFKEYCRKQYAVLSKPRLTLKDQIFFAKRLSFFVRAGVPLLEALTIIERQTRSKSKAKLFNAIAEDVASGQYLATSLAREKGTFSDFGIHIIKVGEQSGILTENLAYLADELTKRKELRGRVLSALIYPAFITVATLGVTILLTVYIFPKILPIFTSLHVPLPLTTRALIAVSFFFRSYGILTLLILIFLGVLAFVLRAKYPRVRYAFDNLILKLPIGGGIAVRYNLTTFSRTLGLMLRSGVPITQAMMTVSETTPNLVYKYAYQDVTETLVRGETISVALNRYQKIFPDTLTHMIAVGEKTGNLSDTLIYLSELYETEVNDLTKNMSSSIEPILMLVMGLIVGLIAVSVITPIYELTQHISPK